MDNLINRQDAIKNAHFPVIDDASYEVVRVDDILALPSADLKKMVGCTGCEHYDQQQTAMICRECRRYYKDKHSEYERREP